MIDSRRCPTNGLHISHESDNSPRVVTNYENGFRNLQTMKFTKKQIDLNLLAIV